MSSQREEARRGGKARNSDDGKNIGNSEIIKFISQNFSKKTIFACSSGWVAVVLNLLPGLGTGYIYQRRWKAYWITTFVSFAWVYFDLNRQLSIDPSDPANSQSDMTGILGLIIISSISAFEAVMAVRKERELLTKNSS